MIAWYLSLARATWQQRLLALLLLVVAWVDFAHEWSNLNVDLAVARWIAWTMVAGTVLLTPMCLFVLVCRRVPRSFGFRPGSLAKTVPQIHEEIKREHSDCERKSRRF